MKSFIVLQILVLSSSILAPQLSFSATNKCEDVFKTIFIVSKVNTEYFRDGSFLGIQRNDSYAGLVDKAWLSENPQYQYLESIGLSNSQNMAYSYVLNLNEALSAHIKLVQGLVSEGKIEPEDAIYPTKSTGLIETFSFISMLANGDMPISIEGGVKVQGYNFQENVTLHDFNHLGAMTNPEYMKSVRRAARRVVKDQTNFQIQKNFTFFFEFLVLINPSFKKQIQQLISSIKNKYKVSLKYREIISDNDRKIQMGEGFNLHLLGIDPSKLIEFYSDVKEIYSLTKASHFWEHYGGSVRGFEITELSDYDDIEKVLRASTILLQFRPDLTFHSDLKVLSLPDENILKHHPITLERTTLSAWTFILALEEIINLDMESLAKALFEDSEEARQLYKNLCKRKIMPFSVCPDQNLD